MNNTQVEIGYTREEAVAYIEDRLGSEGCREVACIMFDEMKDRGDIRFDGFAFFMGDLQDGLSWSEYVDLAMVGR